MTNRPIASLSPTLLARKGAARPAMRPQIQPLRAFQESAAARQLDDLGWNDMGTDAGTDGVTDGGFDAGTDGGFDGIALHEPAASVAQAPIVAEVVALKPSAEPVAVVPVEVPEVVRQQDAIVELLAKAAVSEPEPAPAPAPRKAAPKARQSALSSGRRAAFTLRLDAERHLKLRLASVTSNRSAQQLVTEALDRLIAELPDVADLAGKLAEQKQR